MSRNKARLVAMQGLFQLDDDREGMKLVIEFRAGEEELAPRDSEYLENLVRSVVDNQTAIDELIGKYSIGWDVSRLGKVERAILRLAIAEMLYMTDIPVSVSINEAVLLAKKYGADQASKFINGILGKFSREELDADPANRAKRKDPRQ